MLEFISIRTKVLAGVAVIAAAGAVASGIVDHKKLNAGDGSCDTSGAGEAVLAAAETIVDGAETTTQEIVGE